MHFTNEINVVSIFFWGGGLLSHLVHSEMHSKIPKIKYDLFFKLIPHFNLPIEMVVSNANSKARKNLGNFEKYKHGMMLYNIELQCKTYYYTVQHVIKL